MKFLVPNYSCLQTPCLGGYHPQDPHSLCPQLNLLKPPPKKIPGYATVLEYDTLYSSLLGCCMVFVSKLFRTFQRHCGPLKCPKLFIQQYSITSQKP